MSCAGSDAAPSLNVGAMQLNVSNRGQGSPQLLLNGQRDLIRTFDPLRDERVDYRTITLDGGNRPGRKFGVSWSGALAQEFALRYQGMVRRLILAATSASPAMLVKPADISHFFSRSKSAKLRKNPHCASWLLE